MATVTGYTSARMKQIEDKAIINGTILGDNLILITYDGTEINAGNVRGPQGIQGPEGSVSPEDLAAAIADAHADGAILTAQLAPGAVTSSKIAASAVGNTALANNAVTTTKINDNTITTAKLVDSSVTADKVAANAITNTKIGTNAVSNEKIGASAVDERTLANSSVATAKIQANAVTEAKLATVVLSSSWANLTLESGWAVPSASQYGRLRYKKVGNVGYLSGSVRRTGASGVASVGRLVDDLNPPHWIIGSVGAMQADGSIDKTLKTFTIDSSGWITIWGAISGDMYGFSVSFEL